MEKKLDVGDCYENKKQLCGGRLNLMEIAREHKVSKKFVRKIEGELYKDDGRVINPEEITSGMVSGRALGPGSIALDEGDCFLLICLMQSILCQRSPPCGNSPPSDKNRKVHKMCVVRREQERQVS